MKSCKVHLSDSSNFIICNVRTSRKLASQHQPSFTPVKNLVLKQYDGSGLLQYAVSHVHLYRKGTQVYTVDAFFCNRCQGANQKMGIRIVSRNTGTETCLRDKPGKVGM